MRRRLTAHSQRCVIQTEQSVLKTVREITLDLKELVMLLGIKAGLGHRTAELQSPWILRHEGATERAARSLTLSADVRANSKATLAERNFRSVFSKGSKGALDRAHKTSAKSH